MEHSLDLCKLEQVKEKLEIVGDQVFWFYEINCPSFVLSTVLINVSRINHHRTGETGRKSYSAWTYWQVCVSSVEYISWLSKNEQ